ncbi:protein activator of alkane oxidation PraB [Pseudomonas sp. B6002]|uniref:alkane oxidation protein activator PraB n=1 Tax=Pseudomonas sp. B6002 TaxID=2726978 RepID=UPI0015A1FE31|nr:alkane oxidation protein activator PraB [Pseudomonas sp. B6002]NVZ50507.1 protein activator of alkane oxidation PraB [Pseudomonas sp. B6002]
MKSLKTLLMAGALTLCASATSIASAGTFSPYNMPFTTVGGTITLKSPSTFGAALTCAIQLTGHIAHDGLVAYYSSATITGTNALCSLYKMNDMPMVLTSITGSAGTLSNVSFTVVGAPPIIPATHCSAATISVSVFNDAGGLTSVANNQVLPGSCTVLSMRVAAPGVGVTP